MFAEVLTKKLIFVDLDSTLFIPLLMIFGISFTIKTILKICVSGADLIQKSYIFSLTPTKPKDVKEATQTGKIQKKKGPIISR